MPEERSRARAPLFDRLVDLEPRQSREAQPLRSLDRDGLLESIRRELQLLLNTRTAVPAAELLSRGRERTVIDYGIPDLSMFSARDSSDQARIVDILQRTIRAYEPRLRHVRVVLEPSGVEADALTVNVSGVLEVDGVAEPIAFPAMVGEAPGSSRVYAAT